MIKIENTEVVGWEAAIRGMRNPLESWEKSDSGYCLDTIACHTCRANRNYCKKNVHNHAFVIGIDDYDLMKKLRKAGPDHGKFMRMIVVYCDITAPLYWWKEFDTYKVGTVANSCSTMHCIHKKEFELDDFSHEHILSDETVHVVRDENDGWGRMTFSHIPHQLLCNIIDCLNGARSKYLETKDKKYWWQMIQLLPSSYNQKRTVMMNYEVLHNMYHARKNHKLDEWACGGVCFSDGDYGSRVETVGFCDWVKTLPYSKLITEEE